MSIRAVNIYILVINNCKTLTYGIIFHEIMRPPFWLKFSLMPHFMAFMSCSRFCVNDFIAKMYIKLHVTFHLIAMVFICKLYKYIEKRHLNYENHLKEYHP